MAVLNTNIATLSVAVGEASLEPVGIITATISLSNELVDVSEIGAIDRAFVAGIRSGTVSGTLFYDRASPGKTVLEAAAKSGGPVGFEISHSAATAGENGGFSGVFVIENYAPEYAVGDMIRATFSARITGEYTIAVET